MDTRSPYPATPDILNRQASNLDSIADHLKPTLTAAAILTMREGASAMRELATRLATPAPCAHATVHPETTLFPAPTREGFPPRWGARVTVRCSDCGVALQAWNMVAGLSRPLAAPGRAGLDAYHQAADHQADER